MILLIEDDNTLQELISDYLQDYNYDCNSFADPKSALEEFRANNKKYTLIILDLLLPYMDGFLKKVSKCDRFLL